MRRVSLSGLLVLAVAYGCARTSPDMRAVEDAVAAMGGATAIQNVQTLAIEGNGTTYRLGQNTRPDSELPTSEVQSYKRAIDLGTRRVRTEVTSANFLGAMVTQTTALDGNIAFNIAANGNAQRTGGQVVQDRRAEYYHHPLTLVQAALAGDEGGATVANLRQEMGHDVVDITTAEGILMEADVYTPGRGGPGVTNLLRNVKERGLRVNRIAPIHGTVVPFAEFEKTAMAPATQAG
jgi:hypothetical protein